MRLFLILFIISLYAIPVNAIDLLPIKIWDGTSVNASQVTLTPFLPDNLETATDAVIVCPGGSYFWLDYATEGEGVARWLQSNGIAAFVLKYRAAGIAAYVTHYRLIAKGNQHPAMIQDVQRSIQLVRENANDFKINPNRLGVMGFSAGGHLCVMSAEFSSTNFLKLVGITPKVSLAPNFIAPIYPVVSFSTPYNHKRSRRGILGEYHKFSSVMRDSLSLEKHVHKEMPPVFLVNCQDDHIVHYKNSELLDSALSAKDIPHLYIQYHTGGHSFGADPTKATKECIQWKNKFINWIKDI